MPEVPVPQPCPYDGCNGTCTYPNTTCSEGCEIEWEWTLVGLDKDPNRPGGWKPIMRPSGG